MYYIVLPVTVGLPVILIVPRSIKIRPGCILQPLRAWLVALIMSSIAAINDGQALFNLVFRTDICPDVPASPSLLDTHLS